MDNAKFRLKVEATSSFLTFKFSTTVKNSKIDWGDGTVETYSSTGSHSHTYASAKEYIIESNDAGFKGGMNNDSNGRIKEMEILDGVTTIGSNAFYWCNILTSLIISDSVTSIGGNAFNTCFALKSLTLGNGLESIGSSAFSGCSFLTSLVIPNSVTSIGYGAFSGCRSLASLTLGNGLKSIGSSAFSSGKFTGLTYTGKPSEWNTLLPNIQDTKVKSVTVHCLGFDPMYKLKIVAASNFLTFTFNTTIANSKIDWGDGTVETYSSTGSHSHTYSSTGEYIVKSDDVGFNSSSSSTSCMRIKEMEIFNGVTSISDYAFFGCNDLTSLVIPDSVTNIRDGAFYNCFALSSLVIPDSVTSIGTYAFMSCTSLTSLTLGNSVTSIGESAFYWCDHLTSLVIPDSVISIGPSAFDYCNALTSLVIPDSVTSIARYTFRNCYALTSLVIPDSVTSIGDNAFYYCTSLESLTLGNGLTSIGSNAFSNGKFTELYYNGTQEEWNTLLPNIRDTKVKSARVKFIEKTKNIKLYNLEGDLIQYDGLETIQLTSVSGTVRTFGMNAPAETVYDDFVLKYPVDKERTYNHISHIVVPAPDGTMTTFYLQP